MSIPLDEIVSFASQNTQKLKENWKKAVSTDQTIALSIGKNIASECQHTYPLLPSLKAPDRAFSIAEEKARFKESVVDIDSVTKVSTRPEPNIVANSRSISVTLLAQSSSRASDYRRSSGSTAILLEHPH